MINNKKQIKNVIYTKKINNLKNFAILFDLKNDNLNLTRITRTQFLKLNKNIFFEKTLPANIYFYEYKSLNELEDLRESLILIKYNNNYFFENQINQLFFNNIVSLVNNKLGFYKKFYLLLKTISFKK